MALSRRIRKPGPVSFELRQMLGFSHMTYVDESDHDGLNSDEYTHGVYSIAKLCLREDPVVDCQYASFDEQ
jgi:hypothetical protein